MGHAPEDVMCIAINGNNPAWTNCPITEKDIRKTFANYTCPICVMAKRNIEGPRKDKQPKQYQIGECISADPAISINPTSSRGYTCYFLFKDVATGYLMAILSKTKESEHFATALEQVVNFFRRHNHNPKYLRCDYERIGRSKVLTEMLIKLKLGTTQHSAPHRQFQNSVERSMQIVTKGISALMHQQIFLRKDFWDEALHHYINLLNNRPNKRTGNQSPQQIITGTNINIATQFNFTFGDIVCIGLPKKHRQWKYDIQHEIGLYLGQELGTVDAHRVYLPFKKEIVIRGSVHRLPITPEQYLQYHARRHYLDNNQTSYDLLAAADIDLIAPLNKYLATKPKDDSPIDSSPSTIAMNNDNKIINTETTNTIVDNTNNEHQPTNTTIIANNPPTTTPINDNNNTISTNTPITIKDTTTTIDNQISDESNNNLVPQPIIPDNQHHNINQEQQPVSSTKPSNNISSNDIIKLKDNQHKKQIKFQQLPQQSSYKPQVIRYNTRYKFEKIPITSHRQLLINLTTIAKDIPIAEIQLIINAAIKRDLDTPTVRKALLTKDPKELELWKQAIRAEVTALLNGTLTPDNPNNYTEWQIVFTTTQLKRKRSQDGTISKYKARTCARGDLLHLLINTYSPTINNLTFSLVLQLIISLNMHIHIIDTVAAYLYQPYPQNETPLLVKLEPQIAEICNLNPDQHYRLNKYIYGLPHSGRAYFEAYTNHLKEHGYKQSLYDPCLLYLINDKEFTIATLHVDDTMVASTTPEGLQRFADIVQRKYNITINTNAQEYLGLQFTHHADHSITINQPKLITEIIEEYLPQLQNPPTTINSKQYLRLLGKLLYLTKSRPDLNTIVSYAATKSAHPTIDDYTTLLKSIKYINKSSTKGLNLRSHNLPLRLHCYVDASYLTHPDSKGHTGYTIGFSKDTCFYTKSSKQNIIATSSTEAEYRAIFSLAKDIEYITNILKEININFKQPAYIYEDNLPVIQLTQDTTQNTRKCKHFLMHINKIQEYIEHGLFQVIKVKSEDNLADFFTKQLTGSNFKHKSSLILGQQHISSTS